MKDLSQYNAYMGETPEHHNVCTWCPDAKETEVEIKRMEENRVFLENMKDNFSYRIKLISHGICTTCYDAEIEKLLYINSN